MLFILGVISILAVLASRYRFPFPVLLVFAGLGIGLMPGLPHVQIDADVVFLLILPPLLYSSAVLFPWSELRANIRSILLLAIGLVLATMTAVAYTSWLFIPGMTLAAGFVLGAIVSPPDAIAANAVLGKLSIPRRIQNVLEGESLVNDSSGLVAWQFAVAALVTGAFSFKMAAAEFFVMSIGGTAIGLVAAFILRQIFRRVNEAAVELTLSLMTPYIVYLLAEQCGVSGVLATVAAGIYLGHHSDDILSSRARLDSGPVWGFVQHLLNSLVFILIGLQFPAIMKGLHPMPGLHLIFCLLLVVGVVIVVRFAWIFAVSWLLKRVFVPKALQEPPIENRHLVIMSWCGMRGVVSLAAALAIPHINAQGEDIPERNLILFLTFGVIFSTLILPSLTLPWLVRKLRADSPERGQESEFSARVKLMQAGLASLNTNAIKLGLEPTRPVIEALRSHYEFRLERYEHQLSTPEREPVSPEVLRTLISLVNDQMRKKLRTMSDHGEIEEPIRLKIRRDIDAMEQRLFNMFGG